MKKSTLKLVVVALVLGVVGVALSVYSCEKQNFVPNTNNAVSASEDPSKFITEPGAICGEMTHRSITDANRREIGTAYIYNDTKYFYVMLAASKGFYLGNAFLQVSDKIGEIPLDSNQNADFKNFEYSITPAKFSTMRKFRIPTAEISGYNFVSAAVQTSTDPSGVPSGSIAWIEGKFYGAGKPGKVFRYTKGVCLTDDAQSEEEVK
jgi:hypothetical protein